mgnify:CR=1 FL=1
MRTDLSNVSTKILIPLAAAFAFLLVASCGGPEEKPPCTGVTCNFGTCNPESGECANKDSCRVDRDCIPGYECGTDNTCTALNTCKSDGDCDAGVCKDGTCVNPKTCEKDDDCLPRTFCEKGSEGDGKCQPDPCNDVTCQRGTCQRGTDRCVSKESCTQETEIIDCLAGQKCVGGSCKDSEGFCSELACQRGTCSFEDGECVNADNCGGDDSKCLEGMFCDETNTCREDLCTKNKVVCANAGVCVEATGKCENAESCKSTDDCVDNHLCVDGTCRQEDSACGDADGDGGCPGNQTCNYDEMKQTTSCEEPDSCESSIDCNDDRQCGGLECLAAQKCSDDKFEPNDASGKATVLTDVAENGNTVSASICSGDKDVFKFDTKDIYEAAKAGTLEVEVNVPERDRGLGEIEVRLLNSGGTEIGKASTGALSAEGVARVRTKLGIPDLGEHTIEVSAGGDVKSPGVSYELSANMLPQKAVDACANAKSIKVGQRISGTTKGASSEYHGSSCTTQPNASPEMIYAVKVDEPQELTFELTPQLSNLDLSMNLRERCTQIATERSCVNAGGDGAAETMTALLGPGTYYLTIQSASGMSSAGGPFNLNVSRVLTTCAPSGNYCDGNGNSFECTGQGGRFKEIACERSCNASTGLCRPATGNTCRDAETINPMKNGQRTIKFSQLRNNYEVKSGGCLGTGSTRTGGPDQTYKVEVPAKRAFTATVNYDSEVEGSLALVTDCSDTDGTCEEGAIDSTKDDYKEELTYTNTSMKAKNFYLIVDTEAGQGATTATLDVKYEKVVCTPDMKRCHSGDIQQCASDGTKYEVETACGSLGCTTASACTADTCMTAQNATMAARNMGGVTYSGKWTNFSDDISGSVCGSLGSIDTDGNETVYQVDLKADDVLDATLSGDGDFGIYLTKKADCGSTGITCLAHQEEETDDPASITYVPSKAETVYVVADREAENSGSFKVKIELTKQQCSPQNYPASCKNNTTLKRCNAVAQIEEAGCPGCNGGVCSGDKCGSAISVPRDGKEHVYRFNPKKVYSADYDINGASCMGSSFDDSPGPEAAFQVSASKNDLIVASWQHDDPSLYVTSNCSSVGSNCVAGSEDFGFAEVQVVHQASSAGNYFIIPDVDEDSATPYTEGTFKAAVYSQACTPSMFTAQCTSPKTRSYCDSTYNIVREETCLGCQSGNCPSGNGCMNAIPAGNGDSDGNTYIGSNDIDPVGNNATGNCTFSQNTAGADWVYEIQLQANQKLTADYVGNSCCDTMYLLKNCAQTSSCVQAVDGDGQITYTAGNSAETVYVVMDHNSYTNNSTYNYTVNFKLQ